MGGGYDYIGDMLVKLYLRTVYESIGQDPPPYLRTDYYPDEQPYLLALAYREESRIISPVINGFIDNDEWNNSSLY